MLGRGLKTLKVGKDSEGKDKGRNFSILTKLLPLVWVARVP